MTTTLLSVPTPQRSPLSQRHYIISSRGWSHAPTTLIRFPTKLIPLSSSSSTSVVEEEGPPSPPPSDALPVQPESSTEDADNFPIRGCKACGREEIEKGCNGEGRIQGGIATVPGFGWWPIKAYRPCPGFVASGGRYRRQGQSMDEVVSGGGGRQPSMGTNNDVQSSKKKQSPRKFNK